MRDKRLRGGEGRQENKENQRKRKRYRKRGERPSAITAVSTPNCLDEISMIRGHHNLSL